MPVRNPKQAARNSRAPFVRSRSISGENEFARGTIFLRRDAAIAVRIGEPAEVVGGRLRFWRLEQDVAVAVMEFQRSVHQHPVAFEQGLRGGRGGHARRNRLSHCRRRGQEECGKQLSNHAAQTREGWGLFTGRFRHPLSLSAFDCPDNFFMFS